MKRIVCILLAMAMSLAAFTGCSGQPDDSAPEPQMLLEEGTVLSQEERSESSQGSGEVPFSSDSVVLSSQGGSSQMQASSSVAPQSSQSSLGQSVAAQSSSSAPVSSQSSSSQSSASSQPVSNSGSVSEDEYRAVWFSYLDLSGMLKGQSQTAFRQNIKAAFKNISDLGCNVAIVQVRPFGDALYDSDYFPWSYLCTGTEGKNPGYDPLQVMIEEAHGLDLEIEAWVNPYRIRPSGNNNALSASNIASQWEDEGTDAVIRYNGGIYYNPAQSAVRELIVDGVQELAENYDLDGIHFDDYFYPSPDDSFDNTDYQEYKKGGGSLSRGDWRRENVNILIRDVYSAIKAADPSIRFGVSPQGNTSNNYNSQYIDVDKWLSNKGYVDYICPQIYFGFDNSSHPFTETVELWNNKIKVSGISLYIGLAPYKIGLTDSWAGSGQNEWISGSSILARQVQSARDYKKYGGFALFRYASLFAPGSSVKSQVEKEKNALADVL
ncbi:MAG: family 10 glycosylhydrolase [Oscillospiraceae bacterium]|nr:family 10 glycosylhydrolase [Oscillospiraceae bacterium]